MKAFISFQTDGRGLAIEPVIRHTIKTCREINNLDRVKPFMGGVAFRQETVDLDDDGFEIYGANVIEVDLCHRCYCQENYNREYIDSGGLIDGLGR